MAGRRGDDNVAATVAFAPDGRTLAVGCADGVVRLWDLTTGNQLLPLVGHKGAVRAVRFTRPVCACVKLSKTCGTRWTAACKEKKGGCRVVVEASGGLH